jgi:hypothetical protein
MSPTLGNAYTGYFEGPLLLTLGLTYETDEEGFENADNKEFF